MLEKMSDLRYMQRKTHEAEVAYKAEQTTSIEAEAASQKNVEDLEKAIATAEEKIVETKANFKTKDEEFKAAATEELEAKKALEADEENEDLKTAYAEAQKKAKDASHAVNEATEEIKLAKEAK